MGAFVRNKKLKKIFGWMIAAASAFVIFLLFTGVYYKIVSWFTPNQMIIWGLVGFVFLVIFGITRMTEIPKAIIKRF